jgi:ligand-binding sensor domain-containing protein
VRVVFLLIFLASASLTGQKNIPDFSKLSVDQGLANVSVYALLQDSQGFIWVGTQGGLSRFDGYSCVNYYNDPSDITTLKDNFINCILDDKDEHIWVGTRTGISRLNKRTNHFENFEVADDLQNKKLLDVVYAIAKDNKDNLWLGTKGGLLFFNILEKRFTKIDLADSIEKNLISNKRINDISISEEGKIWLATDNGLLVCHPETHQVSYISQANLDVKKICISGQKIWLGTTTGVYCLDTTSGNIIPFAMSEKGPDEIYTLCINSKNQILAGTLKGVKVLDLQSGKFSPFFENERVVSWYQSNRPQAILEDWDHTYWIATFSDGVYHYDPSPPKFLHYNYDKDDPYSLNENSVYGLCEDRKGNVWVGTSTDLNILDKTTGKFRRLADVPTGIIWRVFEDNEGVIWAGGRIGLLSVSPSNVIKYYRYKDGCSMYAGRVSSIFQDNEGIMWFGGRDGLYSHKKGTDIFETFSLPKITPDTLLLNHITEDQTHQLWISSNYGLYRIDKTRKHVVYIQKKANDPGSLSDNNLSGTLVSKKGDIWVSSINYGLNKFEPKTQSFSHVQKKDGLPDEKIWGILEDNRGLLWLSTSRGLSRYDPVKKSFLNFDIHDGLQSYEFNMTSSHKGKYSDKLYFGGINGFNVFHPDSIHYSKTPPKIVFTSMMYHKGNYSESELSIIPGICCRDNLILPSGTKAIVIEFSALNYIHTFKNQYAYLLKDVHQNWIQMGGKHEVTFANLEPGSYTLLVKASNSDGYWTKEPVSLHFRITPTWWQALWFKILILFGVLYLVYAFLQYNISKRVEMEEMRTQIASDLHDEVGSMLSGLAMQSELLLYGEEIKNATRLENIALISRSVIGKMRDLVWSIDSRRDSFESLTDRMQEQAADMLQPIDIGYSFKFEEILSSKKISVLVRQQLFLIFNEALTNIVRHSNASRVQILIGNFGNEFILSVHDNGTQNGANLKTSGMGKSNMEMRAKKLGASIQFNSDYGYEVRLSMKRI